MALTAFNGDWIWDDTTLVKDNETLRSLPGLGRIWFAAPSTDYWPLTWTLLWISGISGGPTSSATTCAAWPFT